MKLKDKTIKEYTIKVSTVREHFKEGNLYTWGKRFWCVRIKQGSVTTSFGDTTQKKLWKRIKKELRI